MERGPAGIGTIAHAPIEPQAVPAAEAATPFAEPLGQHRYGERDRPNWIAIALIALGHVLLIAALAKMDVISLHKKSPPPLVVDLLSVDPAPPPRPADPKPEIAPVKLVRPPIVAPPPIVQTPAPPPPVAVAAAPPPPQAVIVAAPAKTAAPSAPEAVDLEANLVSFQAPRYPIESRKRREEGTVTLSVTIGVDGGVAAISVLKSSGFDRLDKAALEAVRRWRWKPTIRGGQAVAVRGYMPFPFVLHS